MGDIDELALVEDLARRHLDGKEDDIFQFCRKAYAPASVPISYQALIDATFELIRQGRLKVDEQNKLYLPS